MQKNRNEQATIQEATDFVKTTTDFVEQDLPVDLRRYMPNALLNVAVVRLLSKKVKQLPSWDAAIGAAKSRDIDMLSAATETVARTKYMTFTRPHIELPGVIIVEESKKQFSTLKSLHGKKVGVVSNYVWQEWVTRDHPNIKLHGGTLNIDSELGVGTTVSVNLMPDRAISNSGALSKAAE